MIGNDAAQRIYADLFILKENLEEIAAVKDVYFLIVGDNVPPPEFREFPAWEDVLSACTLQNRFLCKIAIHTESGRYNTLVLNIQWKDCASSSCESDVTRSL